MSYSRWAWEGSEWYIFWTSDQNGGNEPTLAIWWAGAKDLFHTTYSELKKRENYSYVLGYDETDQKERVDTAIKSFIEDVEYDLELIKNGEVPIVDMLGDWRPEEIK